MYNKLNKWEKVQKVKEMVYVVMFGWDYEGFSCNDCKSFKDENKAKEYGERVLNNDSNYDCYEVISMEVE